MDTPLDGGLRPHHGLDVRQQVLLHEAWGEVLDRPAHVALPHVELPGGGGSEPRDAKLAVDEDGGDLRAQVVVLQIALGGVELLHLPVQLVVGRLHLLLGGLQLLVGRLQLLVRRDELLVGGLELLVRRLDLLHRRLQIRAGGPKLVLELLDDGLFRGGRGLVFGIGLLGGFCHLQHDGEEARIRCEPGHRPDREVQAMRAAVHLHRDVLTDHLPSIPDRLRERGAHLDPQAALRQIQEVVGRSAHGSLQVPPCPSREVQDVAALVHHRAGRGVLLEHHPLEGLAEQVR